MSHGNLTAILYGVDDLRLEETEIEVPADDEVLLRMATVGICGSDVHYLVNGRIGDFVVRSPMIMGHEASGTVIEVGRKVENLKIGDRVAIEPGVPCRTCEYCRKGRYNLCKEIKFCATPPFNGNLRRYYKHAADFCFKLPENVTLEEGALCEPLSVGVRACKRGNVGIESDVLIFGAGPVGLTTLLAAKSMGARKVVVADVQQYRLDLAIKLKADAVYLINKNDSENDSVGKIHKLFDAPPNITIDAAGAESTIRLSILVTKTGGTVVLVGMGSSEIKLPVIDILVREIDVRGVFRYVNDYPDALNLIATGKVNVGSIVTHRYSLEETLQAFEMAKSRDNAAVKILISCD